MRPSPPPLPAAVTSKRDRPATSTSYLLVGTGWRSEPYLRLAAMLPERFRLTGVVGRSQASRDRVAATWGVPVFADLDDALTHERPDFVVLGVPWEVTPDLLRRLVALDVHVLTETPPAPDLAGLDALWTDVGASDLVQVAEQYALMPMDAARLALVDEGLVGTPGSVLVSSTHLYHAVALMRRYLGVDAGGAVDVAARTFVAPLVDPRTPDGWTYDMEPQSASTVLAGVDFGDGRVGRYDFTDNQWWNPLRPDHLTVRGSAGEIADATVVRMLDPTTPITSTLERVMTGVGMDYAGVDLTHIAFEGRAVWRNAYEGARLSDDDLGVAVLLDRTGTWARGEGAGPYPLREACQDHAVGLAIEEAAASGRLVHLEPQPWA